MIMSGLKSIDVSKLSIDPDAVRMFSHPYAFSKRFMPIKKLTRGDMCAVKIAVPDDLEPGELEAILENIRDYKGLVVMPVYAKSEEIDSLLREYEDHFSWS